MHTFVYICKYPFEAKKSGCSLKSFVLAIEVRVSNLEPCSKNSKANQIKMSL